ncbi:hypothetical protein CYMTET_43735 [Cymbomonas tetramitiformis]|uniref:Uncharacterized protein n=1 Tax=Cymbomonas tetramitiformis TaxID=36881 RepID=A0AAE0EZP7_9CHLO|nr:hypothetical protein CYMTET_43735 [Cymbomonas tetramitiformis]
MPKGTKALALDHENPAYDETIALGEALSVSFREYGNFMFEDTQGLSDHFGDDEVGPIILQEGPSFAVHINQNHPDDPMLAMHVSEEKLKAMQGENDPPGTFSTYNGVRDHDTRIADDFETLLIEHELVDEEMAEAFGEE